MRFDLTKPCNNCPFRTDITFYLQASRVREILDGITCHDQTFSCHKTMRYDEEGEPIRGNPTEQHCAGALILLERCERSNQLMRIAERVGLYDRTRLAMRSPVFATPEAMQTHYDELE